VLLQNLVIKYARRSFGSFQKIYHFLSHTPEEGVLTRVWGHGWTNAKAMALNLWSWPV